MPQHKYHFPNIFDSGFFGRDDLLEFIESFSTRLASEFGTPSRCVSLFDSSKYPKVNIWDDTNTLKIQLTVPGVEREEIEITLPPPTQDDASPNLVISTSKIESQSTNKTNFLVKEFRTHSWTRSFRISTEFELDKVEATLDKGLLTLSLPRRIRSVEKPRVKRIEIKKN